MPYRWVSQPNRWFAALLLCLGMSGAAFSAPVAAPAQTMSGLEQQFFSRTYPSDAMDTRLDRLESTVFGAPDHQHTEESRLAALSPFLKPVRPAVSSAMQAASRPAPVKSAATPSATETDYPVVTTMETRVFGRSYPKEPLDNRLGRLESRVFGRPQPGEMDLRTDHLRAVVLRDNSMQSSSNTVAYGAPSGSGSGAAGSNVQVSADLAQALDELEKKTFHQTYSREPVTTRLDRLETKVFNQTAPDMSPEDRLYRVVSVMTAQRSSQQEQAYSGMGTPSGGGFGYSSRGGFSVGSGMGGYYGRYGQPQRAGGQMGMTLLMLLMSLL